MNKVLLTMVALFVSVAFLGCYYGGQADKAEAATSGSGDLGYELVAKVPGCDVYMFNDLEHRSVVYVGVGHNSSFPCSINTVVAASDTHSH
jgi:hypothetical protein